MNKICKGRKEKRQNYETVETGNKVKSRKTRIIVPLIVVLMLICVVTIILVVGAHSVRPSETAELNKNVELEEEQISAAEDIAATTIGTNTKATFTASTGEIHIYNSNKLDTATITKSGTSSWYAFLKKIIDADGNLYAVKSITFDNEVYAPSDSSRLFYPEISNKNYEFANLINIIGLDRLKTKNVTSMNLMFSQCKSLQSIDVSSWNTSNVTDMSWMFNYCLKLDEIDLYNWVPSRVSTLEGMFYQCESLKSFREPNDDGHWRSTIWNPIMDDMFKYCKSLEYADLYIFVSDNMDSMFFGCTSLEELFFHRAPYAPDGFLRMGQLCSNCTSLRILDFSGLNNWDLLWVFGSALKKEDGTWTYSADGYYNPLRGCTNLKEVIYPQMARGVASGSDSVGIGYGMCIAVGGKWLDVGSSPATVYNADTRWILGDLTSVDGHAFHLLKVTDYTISYTLNGGTATGNPTTYNIGTASFSLNQPTKAGYTFTGWTGSNGTTPQTTVTIDPRTTTGNLTYTANWTPTSYTINYQLGGGTNGSGNPTSYTIQSNAITLKEPTRSGYIFQGWTGSNGATPQKSVTIPAGSTGEKTYVANWNDGNASYEVRHYQQKLGKPTTESAENYTLVESTYGTGAIGESISGLRKTYTGFNTPTPKSATISASGTVINYYYTRKSYTLALTKGTNSINGINTLSGAGTYEYGASVTINATLNAGYKWRCWVEDGGDDTEFESQSWTFTMPAQDITYIAIVDKITYNIYYNLSGGTNHAENPTTYYVDTNTITLKDPTKSGYKFMGWTGSNGNTPQKQVTINKGSTGDKSYTANWEQDIANYTVRHWQQKVTGNANIHDAQNYDCVEEKIDYEGTIGENVSAPVKTTYTGFNIPPTQSPILEASGTIVEYWYTRKSYEVTLTAGTGIKSVKVSGNASGINASRYLYGETVTIEAERLDGYTWSNWDGSVKSTNRIHEINPLTTDITCTANATPNTNTPYIVRHWQQKVNKNAGTYNDTYYALVETQTDLTGTTDTFATPPVKSENDYPGFTPPPTKRELIKGNGSTVIDYYYDRKEYSVTLNKGKGISSTTVTGELNGVNASKYLYGEHVTIDATLLSGYTWKGWTVGAPFAGIPEGSETTVPEITGKEYAFDMPHENVSYTANGKVNTYQITYDLKDGEVSGNPEDYTVETESFTLKNPAKAGYTFIGWTATDLTSPQTTVTISKGSIGDRHYIANWIPNERTSYMVRHWKQNVEASKLGITEKSDKYYTEVVKDRETYYGTTDKEVTPGVKTYEGFTSPETQTKIITGDGNLIIDYYYTRNKYTVTLNQGKGVAAVLGAGEYPYEAEVTINVLVLSGYDWVKWSGDIEDRDYKVEFTMPANDLVINTETRPNPNTKYTIYHLKQKLGGEVDDYEDGYELADTDHLNGESGSMVSPKTKEYDGFTEPNAKGISVPIAGDGTLEIKYYYTRNSYEVNLNKGTGIEDIIVTGSVSGEGKDKYLYEEEVTIEAVVLPGYTWDKWTGTGIREEDGTEKTEIEDRENTFKIGLENVEYTANATPNTDTPYVVQHWQQKVDGDAEIHDNKNYTLVDTDTDLTGTTDTEVTPEVNKYAGFTSPKPETVTILGDGKLVVNYYYTRNIDTPYIVEHWTQDLEGDKETKDENNYTLIDTDKMKGMTGATITPEVKDYPGFTAPTPEEVEILGEGNLVVKYYYTRNTDTPYKVKHWTQNLPTENNDNDETTNPADVGAPFEGIPTINLSKTNLTGLEETRDTTVSVDPNNYTLAATDNLTGTTGATITPETKEYEGFTAPYTQTTTIKGDGTTEINYYYKRNSYTITLYKGQGIESVTGADLYLYEERVEIDANLLGGYTWSNWSVGTPSDTAVSQTLNQTYRFQMPANNLEYTANATPNNNTLYIVKHWQQTVEAAKQGKDIENGENYVLVETCEHTGTTDSEIPEEVIKTYPGFTKPEKQAKTISGDKTLEVNYYYKRNTNTPYVVKHWTENLSTETTNDIENTNPDTVGAGPVSAHGNGNYTLIEREELTGITDAEITPITKPYDGFIAPETQTTTIKGDGSTEINYYYTRRTDLTCTVVYIDKVTGKTISQKTIKNLTYEEEIDVNEEIMEIGDYTYDSIEPETLKVGTGENTIKIYYTKNEGKVIVHHYIYDEKTDEYTTVKLVEDNEITGKIGEQYTTTKSSGIPENYIVVDETPENYTGIIEGKTIEINYYYKLKTPSIDSEIGGGIISGGEQDENGNWVIKAGEEIKYEIKYNTQIEDYKGKIKIEVKAELPEGTEIDEDKCDFSGGTYDKETNTINWTKEIAEINTFKNGTYKDGINKEITIVYAEDYVLEDIGVNVTGNTILYYPDGYPGEEDKPLIEDEADENGKVIIHHYIYDEKTDEYTTVKLVEDEEITRKVGKEYTTSKSNDIPENYTCINSKPENYRGEITKETIEVNYYYKLKQPTIDGAAGGETISGGEQDENGNWEITAGEEIKYKATYRTEIEDYIGRASIEMKAKLPEGTQIDGDKCDLAGGTYDEETNTITWIKEIENIDTFENGIYTEELTKEITIVYAENYTLEDIGIKVTGKTTLYYPEGHPGEEDGSLTKDETDERGKVIVYHYIYDEKDNEYTETKLVENEQIKEEIGKEYETKPSDKIPANYECINEQPEGYKGTITKETIKVRYYYKLKTPTIESETGGETISGGEQDENGNWVIKAGEEIKYKVSYKTQIKDYMGKATIEMKAELPEGTKIDGAKCDLAGGKYDEETNTITWIKEIENIDTFENGIYTYEMIKEITIIYAQDYTLKDMSLKVEGKTILYYPDDYPGEKGDESFTEGKAEEQGTVIVHHYIYDEEENKYTTTRLTPDEQIKEAIGKEYTTKPSEKIPANYECINDKPEGHKGTIEKETKEISYYYKLKTAKIEGNGNSNLKTDLEKDEEGNWVIKAGKEVEYEITYEAKIEDYIGKATIEIKAELPEGCKIDQDKSDLGGGTYNEETNTITWIKEIADIDTFVNGSYAETITKNVKIVYAEDYVLKDANLKVTGKITTYYPDDYPEKGGQTLPKEDDPNNPEEKMGKVIVRYVDIETEEGAYEYQITGKIGETYETKEKEIEYYVLVRSEGNTKGEIKEEEQVVTYYYRKLNFNIGIEKTIGTITLNGKNIRIDNKETSKLEVQKEDIKNTELIVKYNIKVTNTGELGGTSKVLEIIPEGYELAYLPEYWKVNRDETLETNVELEAGESKELEVVLRWENKENNLGAKTNIAKIEETKNEANFKDTNEEDNIGEATIVLSIKTGEVVSSIVIVMIMGTLIISSYITIVTVRRKAPEIKDIKFLK